MIKKKAAGTFPRRRLKALPAVLMSIHAVKIGPIACSSS